MDRGMIRGGLASLLAVALASPLAAAPRTPLDWRKAATAQDRSRLRNWRTAWIDALAKARAGGAGAQLAAQGNLFDPDRALGDATPPPGAYRCRTFKLGGRAGASDFVANPWYLCRVTNAGIVAGFAKTNGPQRTIGTIFHDTDARSVFLGAMILGDETRPMRYGRDAGRNMAGLVERVEPARWRIVLPYPQFESTLDVIELVPSA